MEVSQIANLDSHVVIGGGEALAFGMDDSAELYALLSDKIYRDKKRAAMRETICNAWDAHVMVGKTDTPVEITVTDTEIVIRDFGPGIPEHLMHGIYCIYGKSTKVKDEKQTGGFGLGSKSPFAVTDHFNVNNFHEGFKSVYALSRGGAATDGKPDMRLMVRVPTTESGLSVSIPMRNKGDRAEFEQHIRAVAKFGGMLVNLNGTPLPRYDYEQARKTEYCIIPSDGLNEGRVYVLYGTVIYPLMTTDETILALGNEAIKYCGDNSVLLLIAPPNSIGVVPSREALSFSEQTDATLIRLLKKAKAQLKHAMVAGKRAYCEKLLKRDGIAAFNCNYRDGGGWPTLRSTPAEIIDHALHTDVIKHMDHEEAIRIMCKIAMRMFPKDRRYFRRHASTYNKHMASRTCESRSP